MANTERPTYSSDVPISMPIPPENDVLVPMYGFGFTQYGLFHDITRDEYEELRKPTVRPEDPSMRTVRGDEGVEDLPTQ